MVSSRAARGGLAKVWLMVGLGLGLLLVAAPALTRVARSEEMGRTSAFLASDKASIITGASIVAEGGMMAQ